MSGLTIIMTQSLKHMQAWCYYNFFNFIKFSIKYTGQHENSKLNANLDMIRNINVLYK